MYVRAMVRRDVLPDGTVVYSTHEGMAFCHRLAAGVLLLSAVDDFRSPETGGPMVDFDREIRDHGSLSLFFDLRARKTVARTSRDNWAEWSKRNRDRLRLRLLVTSKLVDMAVSVMAMLAGGIPMKSFTDVAEFERAIAAEVPGFRRLPPLPIAAARRTVQAP